MRSCTIQHAVPYRCSLQESHAVPTAIVGLPFHATSDHCVRKKCVRWLAERFCIRREARSLVHCYGSTFSCRYASP